MSTTRRALPVLLLAGLALAPVPSATGSCAGPALVVGTPDERPVLLTGRPQSVEGTSFVEGCDDGGGSTVLGCEEPPEAVVPDEDVLLVLRQGGRSWELGTTDAGTAAAGRLGRVTWQVRLPDDVRRGRGVLVAGDVRLRVMVRTGEQR